MSLLRSPGSLMICLILTMASIRTSVGLSILDNGLPEKVANLRQAVSNGDGPKMAGYCASLGAPLAGAAQAMPQQGPYFDAGVQHAAVAAMRWALDNDDVSVVRACNTLLTGMCAWNTDVQVKMGKPEVGAIAVSVEAIKKYGLMFPDLIGQTGYYRDFNDVNRYEFDRLGGIDAAWNISRARYDAVTQHNWQCFSSNVCSPRDLTDKLVKMGYIEQSMQACRDFPSAYGIRGEVLAIFNFCFQSSEAYIQKYVDNGVIEELVKAIHDEANGSVELDVAGSSRLFSSGMEMLAMLARKNPTWHVAMLKAGAVEEISDVLLHHRKPSVHINAIGLRNDMAPDACAALKDLTGANAEIPEVRLELLQHQVPSTVGPLCS